MTERLPAVAVGILDALDAWVGFVREPDGYRLAFGALPHAGGAPVIASPAEGGQRRDELLAVAAAYFEEALDAPPPEVEATQADLAGLVGWVAAGEEDPVRRARMAEAMDAIDDGLAGDVVVSRLVAAGSGAELDTNEQVDAVDLLASRYRALTAPLR